MSATHNNRVSVTITPAAAVQAQKGFGGTLIVEDSVGGGDFGSGRILSFDTNEALQASSLTAKAKAAGAAIFSQTPRPDKVYFGYIDFTGAAETYTAGMGELIDASTDFYGVVPVGGAAVDPTDAQIVELAAVAMASAHRFIIFAQSSTTALKSGTIGAFSTAVEYDRLAMTYEEGASNYSAASWCGSRLAFDVETTTQGFTASLAGIDPTELTSTERDALQGINFNPILEFYSSSARLMPGVAMDGTPLYEVLIRDYLEDRIRTALAALDLGYEARGELLPVTKDGQDIVLAAMAGVFDSFLQSGKILGYTIPMDQPEITAANVASNTLPVAAEADQPSGAVNFSMIVNLSRPA